MTDAAVFAGGGVAGIAWELGVVVGLTEARPELRAYLDDPATMYVGTSAGSAVAAQLASGEPLERLYAAQLSEQTAEFAPDVDIPAIIESLGAVASAASPLEGRRIAGAAALAAKTVPEERRRVTIVARLPRPDWSERRVVLPAVDAETGEPRFFDRESGVALADAVAASCAVPGVWPPVTIDGHRYIDGGVRSVANADLAAGSDRVLLLAPIPEGGAGFGSISSDELETLGDAAVAVVYADDASIAAFGANPLDPATRPASARAGRELGLRVADRLASELGL